MAWHLYGALNAAKWDKQYSERQIIRRVLPYLGNHRRYLTFVLIFSLLSALVSIIVPLGLAVGLDQLFKSPEDRNLTIIILATVGYFALSNIDLNQPAKTKRIVSGSALIFLYTPITSDQDEFLLVEINLHKSITSFSASSIKPITSKISCISSSIT